MTAVLLTREGGEASRSRRSAPECYPVLVARPSEEASRSRCLAARDKEAVRFHNSLLERVLAYVVTT